MRRKAGHRRQGRAFMRPFVVTHDLNVVGGLCMRSSVDTHPRMRLWVLLAGLTWTFLVLGCPEAEKKHEEVTDKVGHAAKNQLDQVNQRVNAAAKNASDRLNAAAASADQPNKDEGGW